MKNKITFLSLFLFLLAQVAFAQFTRDDIQFWVGEGESESYLVVDFRDDTTDPSFVWGIRYNEDDELSFGDIIYAVEAGEPNFSSDIGGGFLDDIIYNHHSGLSGEPDWWSTWSGDDAETMEMNSGVSELAENERWYGISYGFSPAPAMPTITYPAYSSLWFSIDEFDYTLGEGDNYAVIVVDFVESGNDDPASYAWKVNFDETMTVKEALILISNNDADFQANFEEDELLDISYKTMFGEAWLSYKATDMSNWVLSDSDINLSDEDWFGFAKGEEYSRRPYTPVPAEENPVLGVESHDSNRIVLHPNPASTELYIASPQVVDVKLYDMHGALIFSGENEGDSSIDVSNLRPGVYIMSIISDGKSSQHRFIKK